MSFLIIAQWYSITRFLTAMILLQLVP